MLKWLNPFSDKRKKSAHGKKPSSGKRSGSGKKSGHGKKSHAKRNMSGARVIPRSEHGISRKNIDESALKVLYRLHKSGFHACLVGGAVRDLLLGIRPKDFDIATDATPEQVKSLFRNCRLIGRRFRLAHIVFGRHIIEVATFRGSHETSATDHLHESGRILRDNVFGEIGEDVWRRDFTANALYYDISDFSIIDYVDGVNDVKNKKLRLIGETETRYREDPVRMLRAIRFSAKLGFTIDESCEKAIYELGHLLEDIPSARLYEEALKLFHSGHALQSFDQLKVFDILKYLFPDASKGFKHNPDAEQFFRLAMQSTDDRIKKDMRVTPAFLFAALLWDPVQYRTNQALKSGLPYAAALQQSASQLISDQVRYVSIPKRFSTTMRDIWTLQSRFKYRSGRRAMSVLQHPKFRAGYDFLCLRAKAGEDVAQDCQWWTELQEKSEEQQQKALIHQNKGRSKKPRRRSAKKVNQAVDGNS